MDLIEFKIYAPPPARKIETKIGFLIKKLTEFIDLPRIYDDPFLRFSLPSKINTVFFMLVQWFII